MKLELSFGGGSMDVVYAPKLGRFLGYGNEEDRGVLAAEFGGKRYYSSRSGCSGAGYAFSSASAPLLAVGAYRADTCTPQPHAPLAIGEVGGQKIYCYIPYNYRACSLDRFRPIVYSDGYDHVYMDSDWLPPQEILEGWAKVEWRGVEIPAYNQDGYPDPILMKIRGHGVSALPFLPQMRQAHIQFEDREQATDFAIQSLGWIRQDGRSWLHVCRDGYIDAVLPSDDDPRLLDAPPGGWVAFEENFFWYRQERDQIYMFRVQYPDDAEGCPDLEQPGTEYEMRVPLLEFFAHEVGYWSDRCLAGIEEKKAGWEEYKARLARDEEARKLEGVAVIELLRQNPSLEFSLQDGFAQGYCQPGMLDFLRRHGVEPAGLTDTRTAEQLLALPTIGAMCEREEFARVVRVKVGEKNASINE